MEEERLEKTDQVLQDLFRLDWVHRLRLGVVALSLAFMPAWWFWFVHKWWVRRGWLDLIVGVIFDEFFVAVGLFALVLLIWAIFTPAWLAHLLTAAYRKLLWAIVLVGLLFCSATLILFLVVPVLLWLGIVQ
jgi:hypothetical protein